MQHSDLLTNLTDLARSPVDLPIYRQTKSSIAVCLDVMQHHEIETVRAMLNELVAEGLSYPQLEPLTVEEFTAYWRKGEAFVVRIVEAPSPESANANQIVGAFYLKPNFPGRCSHIANAGFIVAPEMRGQGLGRWMGETMLQLARDRGYRAVMYNLVFATNIASLKLWESLGFQEIGRVPAGVYLPNGQYADAVMLHRSLVDSHPSS